MPAPAQTAAVKGLERKGHTLPQTHIAITIEDSTATAVVRVTSEKPAVDSTRKAVATLPKKEQPKPDLRTIINPDAIDDFATPDHRNKLAVGVLGGYNMGDAKGAFTLGVSVQKPLAGGLQLETGLALVSGAYETYREKPQPPGTPVTLTKEYEEGNNRLLYLQAAPTLGYKLTNTLSAGAGVDAQRLLSSATRAVMRDAQGKEIDLQPLWDFGLTAKLDYKLLSRLKAGFIYRKSLQSTNGGNGAAARDYLQLQLGYLIFK
jgi:hypothetical protein